MTTAYRFCGGVVVGAAVIFGGCKSKERRAEAAVASGAMPTPASIVLDGNIDEWPPDAAGVADGRYLYVRFAVSDELFTLQAANKSLTIYLDTDGNPGTGLSGGAAPIPEAAGTDLEIRFSPRSDDGAVRKGVELRSIDRSGNSTALKAAAADFMFAPTYASGWYEARVSRRMSGATKSAANAGGRVRGVVVLTNPDGRIDGYADPFEIALPPLASEAPSAAGIPAPTPGAVRVMTYNVFKSGPLDRPEAFARIFRAVAPDIVLLQEWDKSSANEIKAWFVTLVPSESGWQTIAAAGSNVAIVSRYPLAAVGSESLRLPSSSGQPHVVRFVGSTVATPSGDFVIGTTHLKCCGAMGTTEDATRLAEAQAINATLKQAMAGKPSIRVVGGDLNLVGTRTPLDVLCAGLDTTGGNLNALTAPVLGDPGVFATWSDSSTEFSPGRLDYLLLSEGAAQAVQAFVLDTTRLSDAVLARHGLRRDDTKHSDHLPIVADIVVRNP